jgi:type IX secretion system PorP/SprF family membrane protein
MWTGMLFWKNPSSSCFANINFQKKNNMKYFIKITIALLLVVDSIVAQDASFSRYNGAPLMLNPALTGVIPLHARRLSVSHRNQWQSFLKSDSYTTQAVSLDNRICLSQSSTMRGNDYIGWGMQAQYDGNGFPTSHPSFSRLNGMVTGSFVKQLTGTKHGGGSFLALGAETGFIQNRLDRGGLEYYIQFENGEFNPSLPGETIDQPTHILWDSGVGIYFYNLKSTANRHNMFNRTATGFNIGLSVKHLNKPAYKFFPNSEAYLNRRWAIHAAGSLELIPQKLAIRFTPYLLWQKPYYQAALAGETLINFGNGEFYTHLGGGIRRTGHVENGSHTDALLLFTRMDFKAYTIAIAYDINVSSLSAASNYRGAYELSFSWYFGDSNCDCKCDCPAN